MKKRFSALVCLCLLASIFLSMFGAYPIAQGVDSEDMSELLSEISEGSVIIEESAQTSAVTSGLIMKVGSNYMLNIGPDHLGRIPAPGIKILDGLAGKIPNI